MDRTARGVGVLCVALAFAAACSDDDDGTVSPDGAADSGRDAARSEPKPTKDAQAGDGGDADSFVVGKNGTTKTIALAGGDELEFEFPASAAGERITLRVVGAASFGDGDFSAVIETLPHGLAFDPPVRLVAKWKDEPKLLVSFADAAAADSPEILRVTADGMAVELPHFSYMAMLLPGSNTCKDGVLSSAPGRTPGCCETGSEIIRTCVLQDPCVTITYAPACPPDVRNQCVLLLGYRLDWTCGPPASGMDASTMDASTTDASTDAGMTDSGSEDDDGGGSGTGGSGGTGGSSGTGGTGGTVAQGGCPQVGQYSVAITSGTCGDLSTSADRQRLDGLDPCIRYFEFDDGAGEGISTGAFMFDLSAPTNATVTLGTGAYSCSISVPNATTMDLTCSATVGGGSCNLHMERTGDL